MTLNPQQIREIAQAFRNAHFADVYYLPKTLRTYAWFTPNPQSIMPREVSRTEMESKVFRFLLQQKMVPTRSLIRRVLQWAKALDVTKAAPREQRPRIVSPPPDATPIPSCLRGRFGVECDSDEEEETDA